MVVSAEKARERAEARRLRILAKANERLDVVSGLVPSGDVGKVLEESPSGSPRAAAAAAAAAAVVDNSGDGAATLASSVSTANADEKENKGSKRMAAMRRRRAQQRAAKEEEKDAVDDSTANKSKEERDAAATTGDEGAVSADKSDTVGKDETKTETKETSISSDNKTNITDDPKDSDNTTSAGPSEPKKSYMGVAKMRRRILKQQKAERLQSINDSEALNSDDAHMERELAAEMAAMGVTAKMVREGVDVCDGSALGVTMKSGRRKKGWLAVLLPPMHTFSRLMTLVFLFGAGLRLGMETHSVGVVDEIHHVEVALTKPWEYGMGGKMAYMVGKMPTAPPTSLPTGFYEDASCLVSGYNGDEGSKECKAPNKAKQQKQKQSDKHDHKINIVDMEDEFDTGRARPRGVSEFDEETIKEPNIDPLFRADLDDLLSKSALPFPIDYAAKFAIGFHRMWIHYLWTLPTSVVKSIASAPKNILGGWIRYPPVVLIFTLLIRCGNKVLLGGGKKLEEEGASEKSKGGFDVMKKATETAKNYIEGHFPWLVFIFGTLYDVVKVDMYVVFCGLLVGLVMPLHGLNLGFGGGKVLGDGEL